VARKGKGWYKEQIIPQRKQKPANTPALFLFFHAGPKKA
jgi:hypothetical protein